MDPDEDQADMIRATVSETVEAPELSSSEAAGAWTDSVSLGSDVATTLPYPSLAFVLLAWCNYQSSACTWPPVLQHSIWHDSDKGELTFTDSEMSGWTFAGGNQILSDWDCFYYTKYATHDIVIYKAKSVMTFLDGDHRPFICMKLVEITTNSFYYYQLAAEEILIGYERISMPLESTAAGITDANAEATLCVSDEINGPSDNEYHVLVKQGMEAEATQTCAPSFFGRYWYNITEDDTTWSCDNTSSWDVCTDRQFMVFNYTSCGVKIAETDAGEVRCLLSISSGSNVLQTVLTTDNATNSFTCILSRLEENTGKVFASLAPNSCKKSQIPESLPVLTDGSTVGQVVQLTPYPDGLCPIVPNSTTTAPTLTSASTDVPTAAIIGGVLGTLALIALVILLILACKTWKLRKCCFSDRKHDKSQTKSLHFFAEKQKKKEKGAKLKDDMSIEDLPHKRIPHFIHEQPEIAPNGTALEEKESKLTGKAPSQLVVNPSMTPVEIPDETEKSSQASFNTMSPIAGKRRNLSSVSLDVASNNGRLTDSSLTQSVFIDSPTKSSRYNESMDESFESQTQGMVSTLSNYLDKSRNSQGHHRNSPRNIRKESKSAGSHQSRSNSKASNLSNKAPEDGTISGLKPIRPISSSESFEFKTTANNQAISELAKHLRQTASSAPIPSTQSDVYSPSSKPIIQTPFSPTKSSKVISPQSPSTTSWETYESVSQKHKSADSSIYSVNSTDNLSLRSITSSVSSEASKHSRASRKTRRTDKVMSKDSSVTDKSQAELENLHSQSTQTDISSLEVLFRAHGYPEQVYPKSVKTGIYYISDSPLEPIEESTEHSEAKISATETDETYEGGLGERNSVRKMYSENTFSSQWTTVEEETVSESSTDSESLTPVNSDEAKFNITRTRTSVIKDKANVLDASLLYRTPTYDGYEPDSD